MAQTQLTYNEKKQSWERERMFVCERKKSINWHLTEKCCSELNIFASPTPPVPRNRCSILKNEWKKSKHSHTHEHTNDAYRKSDMMKWQQRQHQYTYVWIHSCTPYAGPNWISSVWQQRRWQRHISNWLFTQFFFSFLRIFNLISAGVHNTHENSFLKWNEERGKKRPYWAFW